MKEGRFVRQTSETELFSNIENFMFGAVEGMSFLITEQCLDSINLSILYGFDAISHRNIANPSNIMKFGISAVEFNNAWSFVYV